MVHQSLYQVIVVSFHILLHQMAFLSKLWLSFFIFASLEIHDLNVVGCTSQLRCVDHIREFKEAMIAVQRESRKTKDFMSRTVAANVYLIIILIHFFALLL